jgi:hypothetical protein
MRLRIVLAAAIFMIAWISASGAADFYEARLAAGRAALAANNATEAEEDLEIAAFGLVGPSPRLAEAVALLTVSRQRLARSAEVDESIARFIRIEETFGKYAPAALEPFRVEFEALLLKRVPRPTLARIASLSHLVGGNTPRQAGTHEDALKLLDEGNPAAAVAVLNDLLRSQPRRRDLRISLLRAAVLSSNWDLARRQVVLLQPFQEAEVVPTFYGAVALFETGNVRGARELLARVLPRLRRTSYVESYVQKIGGGS